MSVACDTDAVASEVVEVIRHAVVDSFGIEERVVAEEFLSPIGFLNIR